MSTIEPAKLKRILTRLFLKSGSEGVYTKTFDGLSPFQRDSLEQNYSLEEGELPIIGGYKDQKEWLVITTAKIVWCFDGVPFCLSVSDIAFATADFDAMVEKRLTMDEVNEILIKTKGNEIVSLKMEAGGPMCGVWNVLLHLSQRTANHAPNESAE